MGRETAERDGGTGKEWEKEKGKEKGRERSRERSRKRMRALGGRGGRRYRPLHERCNHSSWHAPLPAHG